MRYIGLDVHKNNTTDCVIAANGKPVGSMDVKSNEAGLQKVLDYMQGQEFCVMMESTTYAYRIFRFFSRHGVEAHVVHAASLKMVTDTDKKTDRGLHPAASLFYTMLFADAIALLLCDHGALVEAVSDVNGLAMGMALGGLLTLTPFFLYGWSTQYIEPTLSSMVSVLEIVSAALVGYFIFNETVSFIRIMGMGLVIASVIFLNIKFHKDYVRKYGEYVPPGYMEGAPPSGSNEPTHHE